MFRILIVTLLITSSISSQAVEKNTALNQLFAKEWQARMQQFPSFASAMGDKNAAARLADVSETSMTKWLLKNENLLTGLKNISKSSLNREEQINYRIFKRQLDNRIADLKAKDYQIPFLADSGFHTQILRMPIETEFKTLGDYENYLKRLKLIRRFIEQNQANMNAGLKRHFSMPKIVMQGFTQVIRAHLNKKVEDSVFYQPFLSRPSFISESRFSNMQYAARRIISDSVLPAFRNLAIYFENIYIPNTKISLGASDFPNGDNYYQQKIQQYTTTHLTAKAIHQLGLSEVKRIRGEMQDIITKVEFKGSFKEFLAFLRTSPQFYAKTPLQLLKEASYIAKKMDGQLPKFFTHLPRQPYTVEPVPSDIAPKYTTGRYVSAPLNSTRAGTYWVNTYALDKRPLYVLESLTLHEAVPGHHLQGAINQELSDLPNFRRYSYISAFGEGWALYCEKLGIEAGFYQDPYSDFGRLSYEMWRAARLVIDTGIHAFGWSRQQAIALLQENSALSKHNIQTEVDRYISWPGQALSYKIGELKIIELRNRAEQKLGDKFDIRTFHDAILANGSIPLDILDSQINLYIEQQLE
ncbi:MAG: DUF885 domain-containing protein [Enterobacterales bacterium]|nr:DUF885 domain-containing protein [Enterobacterales bacterium]